MKQADSRLSQLFYAASFKQIIDETVDSPKASLYPRGYPPGSASFVIGALAFMGRIDDALVIHQNEYLEMDKNAHGLSNFVLGVGLIRVSRYDEGRNFLWRNIEELRKGTPTATLSFYAWQGAAFYRYFQCRFKNTLFFAKKSWAAAFGSGFKFGQAMAADLRGHALVRTGQIAAGIKSLESASRLAEAIGNGALVGNIRSSLIYYRGLFGLLGEKPVGPIEKLEEFIKGFDPQDNFSLAAAQVQLARQLALHGDLQRSEVLLQKAAKVILIAGHFRQQADLYLRFAYNAYLAGDFSKAIELIEKGRSRLDIRFDLQQLLSLEGLRLRVAHASQQPCTEVMEQVVNLTAKTGSGMGRNILWRDFEASQEKFHPTVPGDDPFGDLIHLCSAGEAAPYASIYRFIEEGLLGLLNYVAPFPLGSQIVGLDLMPGEVFLFNRGNVTRGAERVSPIMKAFLLAIARGLREKRELVELIWGYEYHALRHDPLLYALINRVRSALGECGDWIISEGGTYSLAANIRVYVFEHREGQLRKKQQKPQHGENDVDAPIENSEANEGLNHRQLLILSELKAGKLSFINIEHCVRTFNTSRITATRDLANLYRRGILSRIGNGRATCYQLR